MLQSSEIFVASRLLFPPSYILLARVFLHRICILLELFIFESPLTFQVMFEIIRHTEHLELGTSQTSANKSC